MQRFRRVLIGLTPTLGMLASMAWLMYINREHAAEWVRPAFIGAVLFQCGYFVLQAILWIRYRPVPLLGSDRDDALPPLTVIIPAYNEGPMVEKSIRSVAVADYPHDRLEIIVVDDGSRDDTYFHVERLRREYPRVVRVIRFAGNRGKRAGLHAAFTAARGEYVLTLDSDSEIRRETLRAMVAPLVADPRVGAVAGRVAVLNRHTLIGRMLEVQYALAFDFGRAAQSAYRTVACCPGALSAFRKSVILPHLDAWLNQTFLGRPVSHGEDQALTNIVLKQGYDTVYQRNAVVHTLAPARFRQLWRMFTRWDRSYIVEGFSFAKFMFTRYRTKNRLLPIINFVVSNARIVLLYHGLLMLPGILVSRPDLVPVYIVAFVLASFFTAMYYLQNERSLRFLYGVLYAFYALFVLHWTLPWALVTVRDERWGTR